MYLVAPASTLCRALWLTMLAGHAPALVRRFAGLFFAAEGGQHAGAALVLLLATLFFLLKLLDVPWLRFKTDRRSCCALALLAGFVHADVLVRSTGGAPQSQPVLLVTATVGALAAAGVVRATLLRGTAGFCRMPVPPAPPVRWHELSAQTMVILPRERLHGAHALRGPPAPAPAFRSLA